MRTRSFSAITLDNMLVNISWKFYPMILAYTTSQLSKTVMIWMILKAEAKVSLVSRSSTLFSASAKSTLSPFGTDYQGAVLVKFLREITEYIGRIREEAFSVHGAQTPPLPEPTLQLLDQLGCTSVRSPTPSGSGGSCCHPLG